MRYNKTDIVTNVVGKQYYKALKYPTIPPSESDIYVVTVMGDRLDLLAYDYYKDSNLWWIIASANPDSVLGSMFPEPGIQLRIPTDLNYVMNLFKKENS